MANTVDKFSQDDLNTFIMDMIHLEYSMNIDKDTSDKFDEEGVKQLRTLTTFYQKDKNELNEDEKIMRNILNVVIFPIIKNIEETIKNIPTDTSLFEILKFAIPIINRLKKTPTMKLEDVHTTDCDEKKVKSHEELKPHDEDTTKILKLYDDSNLEILKSIRKEFNWTLNNFDNTLDDLYDMDFEYSSDDNVINLA